MKPETAFRQYKFDPWVKKNLKNTYAESIQQKSIVSSADKHLCCGGRFVAVELKAEDGILSPGQAIKLSRVIAAGGVGMVVGPQNFEEAKELLLSLDRGEPYVQHEIFGSERFSVQSDCRKDRARNNQRAQRLRDQKTIFRSEKASGKDSGGVLECDEEIC